MLFDFDFPFNFGYCWSFCKELGFSSPSRLYCTVPPTRCQGSVLAALKINPKIIETVTPVVTVHIFGILVKHLKKGFGGTFKMVRVRLVVRYNDLKPMSLPEIVSLKVTNYNWPFYCQGH
jgi:hypothetical protein